MPEWNVRRSVVELIEADSAEEAELILTSRLSQAGFEPYEDDDYETWEVYRWSLHMREAIKTWRERKRAEVEAWEPRPMPEDYDKGR